ncbi:unnamed protein product [Eretmochelys imbricata]
MATHGEGRPRYEKNGRCAVIGAIYKRAEGWINQEEFTTYMNMPNPDNVKLDVLAFWNSHQDTLSNFSNVTQRALSVPPGSIDAESLYSKWDYLQDSKRLNMSENTLEKIMQAYANKDFWKNY